MHPSENRLKYFFSGSLVIQHIETYPSAYLVVFFETHPSYWNISLVFNDHLLCKTKKHLLAPANHQPPATQKRFGSGFNPGFCTLLAKRSDDKVSGKWPKHMETFTNIKALKTNGSKNGMHKGHWLVGGCFSPSPWTPSWKKKKRWCSSKWVNGEVHLPSRIRSEHSKKKLSGNHLGQYMCQGSRTQLQKYWGWVYPSFK